jgi:hypothetical protein
VGQREHGAAEGGRVGSEETPPPTRVDEGVNASEAGGDVRPAA